MRHFFLTGYNKSGTTFLQMLLDSHPQINCPPEHHLTTIRKFLGKFDESYIPVIRAFDERTARQGLRYDGKEVFRNAFRTIVTTLMETGKDAKTELCGLNDNSMFSSLPLFDEIFPDSQFVVIVRDPREAAVSLWYHLKRTEASRVNGITVDDFVPNVGRAWSQHINAVSSFGQKNGARKIKAIRYEDLISEKREEMYGILLNWLKVESSTEMVKSCFTKTDKAKEEGLSKDGQPSFFRAAKKDTWRQEVGQDAIRQLEKHCYQQMKRFGYQPEFI